MDGLVGRGLPQRAGVGRGSVLGRRQAPLLRSRTSSIHVAARCSPTPRLPSCGEAMEAGEIEQGQYRLLLWCRERLLGACCDDLLVRRQSSGAWTPLGGHGQGPCGMRPEQEEHEVLCRLQRETFSFVQLQHLSEAMLGRISIAGYVFSHKMEIIESASWSIQHDARILDCLNWNQRRSVNLWSQDSIIIHTHEYSVRGRPTNPIVTGILEVRTAELEPNNHNFQMTLMQIAPATMLHTIEQDVPSMFTSTCFYWHDDKHGDDVVPVVRVDPAVVDDNTPVVVP